MNANNDRSQTRGDRPLRLLSVVAPMFNEAETLGAFYDRLTAALSGIPFELIAIDDGSSDETPARLRELSEADPRVKVVHLSRNFGHQSALTAGLDHASGDAVAVIDADLQDPPELIPEMVDYWRRGSDVVHAVRRERRGEARSRLLAIRWFYRLFGRLSQVEYLSDSGDFRLIGRPALEALGMMRERNRFLRAMTVWVGFTQTAIPYDRDPRFAGETKYPLRKLARLAMDGIFSFSYAPLRAVAALGFVISAAAFVGIPIVIVLKAAGLYIPGIASVHIVVLLLGGIQLLALGLIGEYMSRVYDEAKRRPLYLVRERVNLLESPMPGKVPDADNLPEEAAPSGGETVGTR